MDRKYTERDKHVQLRRDILITHTARFAARASDRLIIRPFAHSPSQECLVTSWDTTMQPNLV